MHVLIAGCGWLGVEIARTLQARGDRVTGVRRSRTACTALETSGIPALALDLCEPAAIDALPADLDAVIACASANEHGEHAYRRAYVDLNRNLFLAARSRPVRALVFTGSTGVFGQTDGGDVDERSETAASDPTSQVLVEAERMILDAARDGIDTRLVRASGLYGPGRAGVLQRVRDGRLALGRDEHVWMNWCHLEDAAATILAALDRGRPGGVYHATDAHPAPRREVVTWIAEQLGVTPATSAAQPSSRRQSHRRVLGERTRSELGVSLRYPSFRDGLAPLVADAPTRS